MRMVFGVVTIFLVVLAFQNCSLSAPKGTVDSGSTTNAAPDNNDPGNNNPTSLEATVAPTGTLYVNSMITITPSGGTPPYRVIIASGAGTLSGTLYTTPTAETAKILVQDAFNQSKTVSLFICPAGSVDIGGNCVFTVPKSTQVHAANPYGGCAGAGYTAQVSRVYEAAKNAYTYSLTLSWRGDYSGFVAPVTQSTSTTVQLGGTIGRDTVFGKLTVNAASPRLENATLEISSCKGSFAPAFLTVPLTNASFTN